MPAFEISTDTPLGQYAVVITGPTGRAVAEGVVTAAKKVGVKVPVVVRLEGTNVERGKEILKESGLTFQVADSMRDAAEKVVAAAEGR